MSDSESIKLKREYVGNRLSSIQPVQSLNAFKTKTLHSFLFTIFIASSFPFISLVSVGTCWFSGYSNRLSPSYCSTDKRINANDHKVWDIADKNGTIITLVFWNDQKVELISASSSLRVVGRWWRDADGDLRIFTRHREMTV